MTGSPFHHLEMEHRTEVDAFLFPQSQQYSGKLHQQCNNVSLLPMHSIPSLRTELHFWGQVLGREGRARNHALGCHFVICWSVQFCQLYFMHFDCVLGCMYVYKFLMFIWTDLFIITKCPSPVTIFSTKNFGLKSLFCLFVLLSKVILPFIRVHYIWHTFPHLFILKVSQNVPLVKSIQLDHIFISYANLCLFFLDFLTDLYFNFVIFFCCILINLMLFDYPSSLYRLCISQSTFSSFFCT